MLRNWLKKFRLKSVQAGDGQRSVDNIDAMTAAAVASTTTGITQADGNRR